MTYRKFCLANETTDRIVTYIPLPLGARRWPGGSRPMRQCPRSPAGPKMEATEALLSRVVAHRLDAILDGRSLGLGIVDCRLGQLGDPISGCDCFQTRRTA